jgi:hypothetical protein
MSGGEERKQNSVCFKNGLTYQLVVDGDGDDDDDDDVLKGC